MEFSFSFILTYSEMDFLNRSALISRKTATNIKLGTIMRLDEKPGIVSTK
jgi:hypothetical protein